MYISDNLSIKYRLYNDSSWVTIHENDMTLGMQRPCMLYVRVCASFSSQLALCQLYADNQAGFIHRLMIKGVGYTYWVAKS